MLTLDIFASAGRPLSLLCLGAHADDLEIGCAGTVLEWLRKRPDTRITWVVLSAAGARATEARRSARALLSAAASKQVVLGDLHDGHFPAALADLKCQLERVKRQADPDIVFTHRLDDRHQDHRATAEATWQTFRNQVVFEYEIPKYEGDLGANNVYVPLSATVAQRKVRHLMRHFGTQRSRDWFRPETFEALLRLRAVECRATSGLAEAFWARKLVL